MAIAPRFPGSGRSESQAMIEKPPNSFLKICEVASPNHFTSGPRISEVGNAFSHPL